VTRHGPRATTSLPRSVGTTSAAAVSSSSPAAAPAESQRQSPWLVRTARRPPPRQSR
jgi:hypothetical protein